MAAAALVGGSFLSASLQVLFDRMASREFMDFFKARKLDNRLLKQLRSTMRSVKKVLNDAEEKQITDSAVKEWLDELKDALYEADDLLDEIAYEALRSKLEPYTQTTADQVQSFFSSLNPFNAGVEAKLEKIVENLNELAEQMDDFDLKEGIGEKSWSPKHIPTTSLLGDSGVYGRDDDKKAIMKFFDSDDKNLGIIAIVGMGGIGKTTLAQFVYKETVVQQRFDLKAWVCVSQEPDILKVTKEVLKEFGLRDCDAMTANHLHLKLEEESKRKRFLLVLDDPWNDDRDSWDFLLKPLKSGLVQGSKIIVTTRSDKVASAMSTVSIHHLQELSPDDCWSVFEEHAFGNENSSARRELEVIGRKIVEKCKGLPLAARTIGGLLRNETSTEEWEKILGSDMWDLPGDKILPSLRLSYHHLPSHLKQCFAYSALFPKGYEFDKEELVLLWMAEGFLDQPNGKHLDGSSCFDDLVSRSFFQQSNANSSCFTMHDLINDLANFVSGEFCFRFENDDLGKPSEKCRHLSYGRKNLVGFESFDGIGRVKILRSFLLFARLRVDDDNKEFDFFQNFECLRVLSLFNRCLMITLPNSIGNLKHLRYLNLQKMRIKRLPDSVSNLYNLQILILYGCCDLIELPPNMMKLMNLCHLDIRETRLHWMPQQISKLIRLQKLTDFFVGNQIGSSIAELGKLQYLQGEICIWDLRNVLNVEEAVEANLKSKKKLKKLEFAWDGYNVVDSSNEVVQQSHGFTDLSQHQRSVLEQLKPHTELKSLSIYRYRGTEFPDWIGHSTFSKMVSLKLSSCKSCCSLPPLGQLVSLKELSITEFDAVETVGLEFYGSCSTSTKKPFGSLEILRFERMRNWHEWICDISGAFPLLQKLYLKDCPSLVKTLPSHLPCLTTLKIDRCEKLVTSFPRAPTIVTMTLWVDTSCMDLEKLSSALYSLKVEQLFPVDSVLKVVKQMGVGIDTLEEIEIKKCNGKWLFARKGISLGDFTFLRSLKIWHCHNLLSFPQGGIPAPNLIELRLCNCKKLKWLPEHMSTLLPSLTKLKIFYCPEIERIPEGGFPSKLAALAIVGCSKLAANLGVQWDLQSLSNLTALVVYVGYIPDTKLLPSTLTSLNIGEIQNLKSLDYQHSLQHLTSLTELIIHNWPHLQSISEEGLPSTLTSLFVDTLKNLQSLGIQHLASVKRLMAFNCPNLKSFPERLPSSLSYLSIHSCPLLADRCKQEEGEDWPNISHIPNIYIH